MRLLTTLKDTDIYDGPDWRYRRASRGILFDEHMLVPLMYVSKFAYHKLPGGGINEGESELEALIREIREEVGSEIEVTGEVGEIQEYRGEWKLNQISYCYLGKITKKGAPSFTKKEINQGFEVVWTSLDEAIQRIEQDKSRDYESSFIKRRDATLLKHAKALCRI